MIIMGAASTDSRRENDDNRAKAMPKGDGAMKPLERAGGRDESRNLHKAVEQAKVLLDRAGQRLHAISQDKFIMEETPLEVQTAIESALEEMGAALSRLESDMPRESKALATPGGPTRQQGQFLAFIREYMMRNEAAVAPSHADFERFFNLTPPSVNSMLIRLEQRGFIRRIPGKARAIEIIVDPIAIPPLERPFRF
jgi:hypothetical protein